MTAIKLPKKWPLNFSNVTKRQLAILQKNEFKICQPAYREVSEYLGFKKKVLLIHLTDDGKWNVKVL